MRRVGALLALLLAFGLVACSSSSSDAAADGNPPDGAVDATTAGDAGSDVAAPPCACTPGATTPCSALAKLYAAGGETATCKPDCSAWDVSACSYDTSGAKQEYVYPGLRDARFANAKCNDGTPFWFQVSLTGSRRWIVDFEGGGACDGALIPCAERLHTSAKLFTSKGDPPDGTVNAYPDAGAILSRNPKVNPDFADANIVVGNYCSSDLWMGTATQSVEGDVPFDLLFAGRLNARAMLQTLIERYGLDDGKDIDVIVTGVSAGGNGARNDADLFADALPNARKADRIWVIPVAGFQIYDWSHPGAGIGGSALSDPEALDLAYPRWSAELNTKCLALAAADGRGPGACIAGLYASRSLVSPEPVGYGLRVLDATNRSDPVYLAYHGVTPATPDYDEIVDAWEPIVTSEMLASHLRWLFSPAHRGLPNLHGLYKTWTIPLPTYNAAKDACASPWPAAIATFRDLVHAFYKDTSPATSGIKICPPDGWPE